MAIAKVYKTRTRNMNFPTPFGLITFSNHRFLIEDVKENQAKIAFIENVMMKDPATGIFVDPNEKERDLDQYVQAREVQHSDVQAFLQQQNAVLDESQTDAGAVNLMGQRSVSNTHSVAARGAPAAQRFSPADMLKAKLAGATAGQTPTEIPESVQKDPSQVATDAAGNPIADVVDPEALARQVLNK